MIKIKRVYEPCEESDGVRILAERLWPRGLRKESLKLDAWLRDVAPSATLRKWFNHEPARWTEFQRRYRKELDENPEAWQAVLEYAMTEDATLLFSSRDTQHNNVVVLKAYLDEKIREGRA